MLSSCAVLVALFTLGMLYVANAGDLGTYPMSYNFTPIFKCQHLQTLGRQVPHLLKQEDTWLECVRRPARRDIGSRMLYRCPHDWLGIQDHPGIRPQVPDGLWQGQEVLAKGNHREHQGPCRP